MTREARMGAEIGLPLSLGNEFMSHNFYNMSHHMTKS